MKKLIPLIISLGLLSLTACTVNPPAKTSVKVQPNGNVTVTTSGAKAASSQSAFCPPGQGKKGNC